MRLKLKKMMALTVLSLSTFANSSAFSNEYNSENIILSKISSELAFLRKETEENNKSKILMERNNNDNIRNIKLKLNSMITILNEMLVNQTQALELQKIKMQTGGFDKDNFKENVKDKTIEKSNENNKLNAKIIKTEKDNEDLILIN
jgi:hypothetical protein